ncbi:MAG: hypothetical protein R6T99_04185 [Bacteroidales bacterium]
MKKHIASAVVWFFAMLSGTGMVRSESYEKGKLSGYTVLTSVK